MEQTTQIAVRLPQELADQLTKLAGHGSRNQYIKVILADAAYRMAEVTSSGRVVYPTSEQLDAFR